MIKMIKDYITVNKISTFKHKDFELCYSFDWKTSFLKIRRYGEDKYYEVDCSRYYDVPNVICDLLDKYVEYYDYDDSDFAFTINYDKVKTELGFNLLTTHIDNYAYSEDGWIYDN